MKVSVECYAGHRADEEPRVLHLEDKTVTVVEILDRHQAPDHRFFRVRGDDGAIYELRQTSDTWTVS